MSDVYAVTNYLNLEKIVGLGSTALSQVAPHSFIAEMQSYRRAAVQFASCCDSVVHLLNVFTTANPFLWKILGISIGKDFGVLEG